MTSISELEDIDRILDKIDHDPEPPVSSGPNGNCGKDPSHLRAGRRTGLGITAEGDMLAALGLRYGGDEAIAFAVSATDPGPGSLSLSVIMAGERGAFPIYDSARTQESVHPVACAKPIRPL
ncbi:MAG: hypothetical protein R2787_07055 [Saprospiraceae bacterium]